jgi:putative DNA primase/helicase
MFHESHRYKEHVRIRKVQIGHPLKVVLQFADTMMDRSVVIPMRRKRREDRVDVLLSHRLDADTVPLRRRLVRFADDNAEPLQAMLPTETPGLRDRAIDNWSPLFAIAEMVGGDWPARARKAAQVLSGGSEANDDTPGLQLLEDCHGIWQDLGKPSEVIGSVELIKRLTDLTERPGATCAAGKGLHRRGLRDG